MWSDLLHVFILPQGKILPQGVGKSVEIIKKQNKKTDRTTKAVQNFKPHIPQINKHSVLKPSIFQKDTI